MTENTKAEIPEPAFRRRGPAACILKPPSKIHFLKNLFYALRPQQWVKNAFVFLPLIFGQKLFISPYNEKTAAAFILFSLTSGIVYLINDILDLEHDKLHPVKRLRPLAAGKISLKAAITSVCLLGPAVLALSFILDPRFGAAVVCYFVFNLVYSKILKNAVIIDVFCIGVFFLLRIVAGTVVADVEFSHWIIFMTVLLALFLGFSKRRQELRHLGRQAEAHREVLTRYNRYFIDQMIAVITSSIVVAYMLYTVDARTVHEFGTNHLIYTIPFVYYGIFRYLYLLHRGIKDGDPTRLLLYDKKMQINILLWLTVCVGVIYFHF